ncbi:MAG TPA: phosphoribosylaminoimidazolesuccinocarboxamide synthase [Candidatus Caenarcaniphilales bacterium]|nr:phosphoribosylaminoimidazolesuccinocarboxamide synthase [Candidatus Caenarcaniphilales bacterium]
MPLVELVPGFVRSGKVRDIYALDEQRLLLVASDRISAFDVVLPTLIPDKGRVLTGLARYWFRETEKAAIMPNHLLATDVSALPGDFAAAAEELRGRVMVCRRAQPLPVELIVRGYLAGSGWKDYRSTGAVCGIPLPDGLRESERLPEPLFTPSTKAEEGHDENIDFERMVELVGPDIAERARELALQLYRFGADRAESAGIIVADTKFEFGLTDEGELLLIDEVLTPDSSRFWDAADYQPGRAQASYDKQFVRDWLEAQPWDKTAPGPELPTGIVEGTRGRYVEAFERITGGSFADYLTHDTLAQAPAGVAEAGA